MRRGIEQQLVLVLAVKIDETAAGFAQRGAGDERAVDEARGCAPARRSRGGR